MNENTEKRPLVTFALFAYNQERFIREAVEGALAQTYSPLQVILSDDCSSDRTFEIMQEMVADYSGPHEILLNRNERNLGIGGHVNRVMELVRGELIVVAAGDDISEKNRVEENVIFWIKTGRIYDSIYSDISWINNYSRYIGENKNTGIYYENFFDALQDHISPLIGCSHAWTKRLFDTFGPLISETNFEDRAIAFRALLFSGVLHIPKKLVRYRLHDSNMSFSSYNNDYIKWLRHLIKMLRCRIFLFNQFEKDIKLARLIGSINNTLYEKKSFIFLDAKRQQSAWELKMLSSPFFTRLKLIRCIPWSEFLSVRVVLFAIFPFIFFYLRLMKSKLRSSLVR